MSGGLAPRSAGTFPQHLVGPPSLKPTSATLPALSAGYAVPCAGRAGRSLPPPRRPPAAAATGPDVSPVLMLYPTATAAASPARARVRLVRSGSPAAAAAAAAGTTGGGSTAPQPRLPLGSTVKVRLSGWRDRETALFRVGAIVYQRQKQLPVTPLGQFTCSYCITN